MAGPYDELVPPPMPAPMDGAFSTWPPPHWGMTPAGAAAIAAPPPAPPLDQPGLGGIPAAALDAAAVAPPAPPPGIPTVTIGEPFASTPPPTPGALPQPGTNPDQPPGFGTPAWMQAGQPPSGSLPPTDPNQPDAISGAGFPGSDFESDHDKITDVDGDRVKSAEFYARHPLDNPNAAEAQAGLRGLSDDELAALQIKRDHAAQLDAANKQIAELTHQQDIARRNYQTRIDADAAATQQANQVNADAIALAQRQVDPDHWWNSRSTGQKISGYIAAIAGGLASPQFGGRNIGLEQINRAIDQDVDAQKANLSNAWKGIEFRKGAVGELFDRNRNTFQAAETFRLASMDMVDKQLAIQQQNFDPRGTTAMAIEATRRGLATQRASALEGLRRNAFDEYIKSGDLATKQYEAETHRQAEIDKANKGKGGAGAGSGTNPNYTVPTGFFDPFTGTPVMGKRTIGGKGEDAKERNTVEAQLATYGHVQDYWAKLAEIGAKVDGHKRLGESVWKGFRDTDAAEYDAAKEALTVYLTKELGDKLTQGQLEAQAHRIPDRATVFESRDPLKQITDAQADADRDFARDTNIVGIDGAAIVKNAQSMRKPPPQPDPEAALADAQEALSKATSPQDKKDAKARVEATTGALATRNERASHGAEAVAHAEHAQPFSDLDTKGLPPDFAAEVQARNRAAKSYAEYIDKYHAVATTKLKPTTLKGDAAKAQKDHGDQVATRALDVVDGRKAVDDANAKVAERLVSTLGKKNFGGLPRTKVNALASELGIDPKKMGDDINGQVEVGKFLAAIDKAPKHGLMKFWFGQDVFHAGGRK